MSLNMFSVLFRCCSFLYILIISSLTCFGQDAMAITRQMFEVVNKAKSFQYEFESLERVDGKLKKEVMFFKINTNPFKAYIYETYPKEGLQMLYVSNKNGGKAKINPGGFPWVTLNLEPEGELMLANRHHSIYDAGFSYSISTIQYLMDKYESQSAKLLTFNDEETIHGIDCYSITFTDPNYRLLLYYAQIGDTPLRIAKKQHINFYSIMENNSGLKPSSILKPGLKLIIPNDYASKMIMYINKSTLCPVLIQIYDSKGLFEEFLFKYVKINVPFKDIDFSETNPAYKF